MILNEFLARLSRGPLSNLSLSNDGDGTITEARLPGIVDNVNQALLRLYTRFDLLEKEVIIEQRAGLTNYKLSNEYALTVIGEALTPIPHIIDSVSNPFINDLIKVLGVYGEGGVPIPLNDDAAVNSVFTPSFNVLQVPEPIDGVPLYLIYQARHTQLVHTNLDAVIELPDVLEEAALAYAAHKVYFHMNGQEHAAKAAEHLATYKSVCDEISDRDLVNSSVSSIGAKFHDRGFV